MQNGKKEWRGPYGMNRADLVVLIVSLLVIILVLASVIVDAGRQGQPPGSRAKTSTAAGVRPVPKP